ncbi:MAG TPA: hypothetical protein VLW53_09060 [Candidatus Eisenbacteria bacterium]|nr:hypothetical protein [Candidatus Eisenbacteria bacterium]
MRQVRLLILAGTGILVLCGVAVAASLLDYVSHPGVAVSHVPPVTGAAGAGSTGGLPASAPLPTTPVTAAPVDPSPSAAPDAPAPATPQQQPATAAPASQTPAKFLQHRRRPPQS